MIRRCARSIAGVLLFSVGASLSQAQTMELIAGGGRFEDLPATEIGLQVRDLVVGPDGYIYVLDPNKYLMRFDPVMGTITALPLMPAHPEGANFDLGYPDAMAFDGAGQLHVATEGRLYVLDLNDGARLDLGELPGADQMAFGADDTLYYVTPEDARIRARSPAGEIRVIAGTGESGFSGDGGPAIEAMLGYPRNLVIGPDGNLYFADNNNARVRKINLATGIISTIAGTGNWEFNAEGLPALQTNMSPNWVAFDAAGNLLIGDSYRLLRVSAETGLVSSLAGIGTWYGGGGDGGPATSALVTSPRSIVVDGAGNIFFAQYNQNPIPGHSVRRISAATGIITRAIGNNTFYFCGDGQPARAACFLGTNGIAVDTAGNMLIVDSSSERLRRVSASTGLVETVDIGPGNNDPYGAEYDAAGNAYFTSWQSNRVFRIDAVTGERTVVAGTGTQASGGDGGPATAASLNLPSDIAFDDAMNMYIADIGGHRVRKIDAATGIISTYAGYSSFSPVGDGGPATAARILSPSRVAVDPSNNLLIVEGQGCRVRKVDAATGIISTVAGNGTCAGAVSGVPANTTSIGMYPGMALDGAGNIFLSWEGTIHRVDAVTGIITRVSPYGGFTTPEGLRANGPAADMEFDSQGRLYLDVQYSRYVFRITGLAGDATPPVIQPQLNGTMGNNGWYTSNVQLSWTVTDADSVVSSSSGCSNVTQMADTAGETYTCTATSSGGTSTQSVTIRKDTNPPFASWGPPSPMPNAAGWSNSNVTYSYTLTDTLSGVSHGVPANAVTISYEGYGVTASILAVDNAGNYNHIPSPGAHIDRTPPAINVIYPEAGTHYGAFSSLNAQYVCPDNLSTQPSCVGTVPHGVPFPTSTPGAKTFTVTATDAAGNVATLTRNYSVAAMQFERWIDLRRSPKFNGINAGSLVPIRWRLLNGVGGAVTNPAAFQSINVLPFSCQGGPTPFNLPATGGPGLSVDAGTGFFTYNWQTEAGSTGCRRVIIQFANGTSQDMLFWFQ